MFDIGPSIGELLLIAVVALIVVGPEKLPATIKTMSLWLGRFRRSFNKIKVEVEQQINADEIRRQLHNESILDEVKNAKDQVNSYIKDAEKKLTALGDEGNEEDDDLFFNSSSNPLAKKVEKKKAVVVENPEDPVNFETPDTPESSVIKNASSETKGAEEKEISEPSSVVENPLVEGSVETSTAEASVVEERDSNSGEDGGKV